MIQCYNMTLEHYTLRLTMDINIIDEWNFECPEGKDLTDFKELMKRSIDKGLSEYYGSHGLVVLEPVTRDNVKEG